LVSNTQLIFETDIYNLYSRLADDLANAGTPIVEERAKELPWTRAKYLHFADNRRPPYYGTWRKRSQLITARRPLGQDKVCNSH